MHVARLYIFVCACMENNTEGTCVTDNFLVQPATSWYIYMCVCVWIITSLTAHAVVLFTQLYHV